MKARIGVAGVVALLTALVLTTTASASEPLEDGDYSVTLPGGTQITFTISDDGDVVTFGALPGDFVVVEDDSSDGNSTRVTDGTVTVEVETGDDGKIEVEGVSFVSGSTLSALLPDVLGAVGITLEGDDIDVSTPEPFDVVDTDIEGDEIEVTISDGTRTFEIEVDLEDGSVEIMRQHDDDSSSDDDSSDDMESEDDDSTETSIMSDSASEDDVSDDDDDSSDETTDSTVGPTQSTGTTAPAAAATSDDDESSDENDESDEGSEDDDSSD